MRPPVVIAALEAVIHPLSYLFAPKCRRKGIGMDPGSAHLTVLVRDDGGGEPDDECGAAMTIGGGALYDILNCAARDATEPLKDKWPGSSADAQDLWVRR